MKYAHIVVKMIHAATVAINAHTPKFFASVPVIVVVFCPYVYAIVVVKTNNNLSNVDTAMGLWYVR